LEGDGGEAVGVLEQAVEEAGRKVNEWMTEEVEKDKEKQKGGGK